MTNDFFQKGVEEIISENGLKKLLKSGKKLRIKLGADPTRPDLHLGHAVALRKLKEFQDEGHKIIFIIGDYTVKIGDPTGRNATRPILSIAEIKENARTYFEQVGKILNVYKAQIWYNSEWYSKMHLDDILQIAAKFTVSSIIDRDDFKNRLQKGIDVGLQELLYPVMQAYDSVIVKADVEIGGLDQKFNILAGRALQKKMGQTPQEIMLLKLLVGLDGKNKMSKSLDNYIGIIEDANSMYGKVMSIPDTEILNYFELCTGKTLSEIAQIKKEFSDGKNPMEIKKELAFEIALIYHGKEAAEKVQAEFARVFSKGEIPEKLPEISLKKDKAEVFEILRACYQKSQKSNSEIRRLIEQKAVEIDGKTVLEMKKSLHIPKEGLVVKVGKKDWFKVL